MRPAARAFLPAILLLAVACGREGGLQARQAPVVLISVDTLRADHLPAYGYPNLLTPHLDALRKDSVLFENAYSHVPLTLPSHVAVMTGLLPAGNGVRDNFGYKLSGEIETLAGFLAGRGYATGAAVSSSILAKETGLDRGFAFYDDQVGEGPRAERDGARTAESLVRWLDGRPHGPVLLFLHLFEPHAPYEPPEPYRSRYPLAYDGEIARADEIVGSFLEKLRRHRLYEKALVILFSDHGEGLGDHGEREHGVFLYREAIRVPLLVKLPKSRRAGEVVAAPVALIDVFPTVAAALGMETPPGLPGISLLAGGKAAGSRRVYSETLYPRLRLGWSDLASLVDSRYQYIEAPRPELYDMLSDSAEKKDLSPGLPPAFRSLRADLRRVAVPFRMPETGDSERARRLVSLGYVSATSPMASVKDLPDPKDRIADLDASLRFGQLLSSGRDRELIEGCREFLRKEPAVLEIWRMLADALERQGKREEAILALKEGLEASSATALPAARTPALERLTYWLVAAGRPREALRIGDPSSFTDPEALTALGIARAQAGLDQAEPLFRKALEKDPENALAHFNLGTALAKSGDLQGAREHLERSVKSNPRLAPAWNALGSVRASSGDESGALDCWRRAVELDGTQFDALYNMAIVEGRKGNIEAARRALERFVGSAPRSRFSRDLAEARRLLRSLGRG